MSAGTKNYQGGKNFGQLRKQQELSLDETNKVIFVKRGPVCKLLPQHMLYLDDDDYKDEDDYPHLKETLQRYKKQFMEYDLDNSGDIDLMELKMMMEKLDQAKTHLELKKMISEVDRENRGAISYNDFLYMMLGKKSSVLKLILKFEEAMKEKERPKGVAPKRDLSSLP